MARTTWKKFLELWAIQAAWVPCRLRAVQAATETIGIITISRLEEAPRRAHALQGKGPTTNEGQRSVLERK